MASDGRRLVAVAAQVDLPSLIADDDPHLLLAEPIWFTVSRAGVATPLEVGGELLRLNALLAVGAEQHLARPSPS